MEQSGQNAENRKFIDLHVKPIFERLMVDILVKKPANVVCNFETILHINLK